MELLTNGDFESGGSGWSMFEAGRSQLFAMVRLTPARADLLPQSLRRAMDNLPNWARLRAFIDPAAFAQRQSQGMINTLSHDANIYRVDTDRGETEIFW
jgi:hypothetical protein